MGRRNNVNPDLKALAGVGISELFDRCVVRTCRGRSIRCCLGLWGVSAPDVATAEREARHYWIRYFEDGEYHKHLSNAMPDSQQRVVRPNRTLTMLWCPVCGCDDQTRRLGRKHFSFGKLCGGVPITITYKLVRQQDGSIART